MELHSGESTTTVRKANYQQLAVMLAKWHNGQSPVAVGHCQLRTMASETVDPTDRKGQLNPIDQNGRSHPLQVSTP